MQLTTLLEQCLAEIVDSKSLNIVFKAAFACRHRCSIVTSRSIDRTHRRAWYSCKDLQIIR